MTEYQKIGVIGGGAWGTALAQTLAVAGRDVTLWAFEQDCVSSINDLRENTLYLPQVKLNQRIHATTDISNLGDMDAVLSVAPAQHTKKPLLGRSDQESHLRATTMSTWASLQKPPPH